MLNRYSRQVMQDIWSDQNKFNTWLKVELLTCEAFEKLGIISKDEMSSLKQNACFNIERILEIEKETRHDVVAFTRAVSENLSDEKKWIHYGLTSTDVVDTSYGYILKQVNDVLDQDLANFLNELKTQAIKYKYTPCIGRTHGVHADITSFGLKFALWYDELKRNIRRFNLARNDIEVGKISGAVGTFANTGIFVQDYVCKELGINSSNISTQTLQRDRHAFYISTLALIASDIEKIGIEIRHLQKTEVREVEEFFNPGQKGSSAMPHKRNPITSENMAGCARVIRGYMMSSFEDIALWHERDISHSSVERIILPDATTLLDYMLNRYSKLIKNLTVFDDNMLKNINKTNGVIFAQRVMSSLINKGLSREDSYDKIQPIAMKAWISNLTFIDLLKEDDLISKYLTKEELLECFSLEFHLKYVDDIYKRVGI
ncbi:MAG: adenylosuccinate lyase [Psittacicella sp.]